jgi:WD40 repeat protein
VHGSRLISRSADGELRVWDMEQAERNGNLRGRKSYVAAFAFSHDGTRLASASGDFTVHI